jgi:hypothetical protein
VGGPLIYEKEKMVKIGAEIFIIKYLASMYIITVKFFPFTN